GGKLVGAEERDRVRHGQFRIVYAVDDASRTVEVVKVGHRREVYRGATEPLAQPGRLAGGARASSARRRLAWFVWCQVDIRAIQSSETEEARRLLKANGWDRGVASAEEFRELLSRSQRVLVAVEDDEVIGFLRAFSDG